MSLEPTPGSPISLDEAIMYVSSFRKIYSEQTKAFYISSKNVQMILDQKNCTGVRLYNGYDEKEQRTNLVMIGVDAKDNDMTTGIIMERMLPCPPYCNPIGPLSKL